MTCLTTYGVTELKPAGLTTGAPFLLPGFVLPQPSAKGLFIFFAVYFSAAVTLFVFFYPCEDRFSYSPSSPSHRSVESKLVLSSLLCFLSGSSHTQLLLPSSAFSNPAVYSWKPFMISVQIISLVQKLPINIQRQTKRSDFVTLKHSIKPF